MNGSIVVTGAARGIGRAISDRLAANPSFEVIGVDLAPELALAKNVTPVQVDLTTVDGVDQVRLAVERLGLPLLGLVNNAGITRDGLLIRMDEADWTAVLDVNLKGVFNMTKAVVRGMMKRRSGRVVNIASVVGITGNAGQANYSASKAGVIGFTKTVAKELASRGVLVNAVAPGFIDTDMTKNLPESAREALLKLIPLSRLGSPDDVARAVLFLSSDLASYITGQVMVVDGGMVM